MECDAAEALLNILKSDTLVVKRIAVSAINSLCSHRQLRIRLAYLGLKNLIAEIEKDPKTRGDPTIEKYLGRIKERLNSPDAAIISPLREIRICMFPAFVFPRVNHLFTDKHEFFCDLFIYFVFYLFLIF
eukprot:gene63-41_t